MGPGCQAVERLSSREVWKAPSVKIFFEWVFKMPSGCVASIHLLSSDFQLQAVVKSLPLLKKVRSPYTKKLGCGQMQLVQELLRVKMHLISNSISK